MKCEEQRRGTQDEQQASEEDELAHLHATSIFLVPLAVLFVLRFLEEQIGARGLIVRLGLLLALQLSFGTEVFFTLSLCLGVGLVLGFLVVPAKRQRLGRALLHRSRAPTASAP